MARKKKIQEWDMPGFKNHIAMPEPSADLVEKIMADAEATLGAASWKTILWPFGAMWKPVMVLSASVFLGVWVGFAELAKDEAFIDAEIEAIFWG